MNHPGNTTKRWLAVYTKPRWEKKVHRLLKEANIESYCPLTMVYRKWSDRTKKVEEPLFKSYVFVHIYPQEQAAVRKIMGVLNFVYWLNKPAIIKAQEIAAIRRFLNEHPAAEVHHLNTRLQPGDKVTINAGLMMGAEATVQKTTNRYAEVMITSLGCKLVARVPLKQLDPATTASQEAG
ncbi:MAG TPA: UpxY family transcription antiterminator [Phnomibacter sp.]|nr:UpxY family transcription antiterminator [Phnomibacter sp.]